MIKAGLKADPRAVGRAGQRGFSLLELIASLAIVSLVSAALFQSMSSWLRLSVRASDAAEESISAIVAQQMFDRAVGGLIYAWPEEGSKRFIGADDGFSGLTTSPLQGFTPRLLPVQISILGATEDKPGRITYSAGDVEWTLREFDGAAALSYLGADGLWRSSWPPETNPEPSPFGDAAFFEMPQLPLAIRADLVASSGSESWIAHVRSDPRIPQRVQDLE